ncbi:N-alpha-acetyltransferase 15/16, NatA auxiliary subunit, partial [Phenoliferia sp. Uapishka_3]
MPPKAVVRAVPKPAGENRALPSKEQALFRQVLQQYETKQWKKGLKTAESILKTRPDHGETLAMKGLFLFSTDKKEEGYEFIKRGVRQDMGSHIVWHVYGLMHRADKNFEEALKCYSQANKIEKDSLNILGDLAILTIHLRKYPEYVEARTSILRAAPRLRRNWIGLAVAQHLNGQFAEADRTMTSYEEMLREVPDREYEHSEVLLYHASILEEAGDWEKCLEFLGEHAGQIVDRQAYSVLRAHLLLKLGRKEPAEWAWQTLLEENPDNYNYIKAFVQSKDADVDSKTSEGRAAAVKVLDSLADKFPRSLAVRRLALDLVSGDEFRTKATKYLTDALSKGVPSIFADIKALYSDSAKCAIIGDLVENYRKSLEATETFGLPITAESSEESVESSAAYLWTLYFLAQHHSALSAHVTALELVDLAMAHTPSLPELSMLKARILKRAGDVDGALQAMTEARLLDGQDRFLNSKSAKYLLRADKVPEAEGIVGLFTKKDAPSPLQDLVDMQCLWFLEEEGLSYTRQSQFALALKRYHTIFNIFTEVEEDQYDFHSYCLRKMTLRAYVNLLRYTDQLRAHPRYIAAAKGAINIYLRLHDDPSSVAPPPLTNGALEEAEQKKKQEKIEAAKAKKAADATKDKGKKPANKKAEEDETPAPIIDADPNGDKLLATTKPLDAALTFLRPLEKAAGGFLETWLLSFEVAIRREKYLQALRALRTAYAIDPTSAALHPLIVRFRMVIFGLPPDAVSPAARKTIDAGLLELMGSKTVDAFNAEILQRGGCNYVVAAAKGTLAASSEATKEVEELLFQLVRAEAKPDLEVRSAFLGFNSRRNADLSANPQDTVMALELLRSVSSGRVAEFKNEAAKKFTLAKVFKSEKELEGADAPRPTVTPYFISALLVGTWANGCLYALEILQVYRYFKEHSNDAIAVKLSIVLATTVDTFATFAFYATVYEYAITHWGDAAYLTRQNFGIPYTLTMLYNLNSRGTTPGIPGAFSSSGEGVKRFRFTPGPKKGRSPLDGIQVNHVETIHVEEPIRLDDFLEPQTRGNRSNGGHTKIDVKDEYTDIGA